MNDFLETIYTTQGKVFLGTNKELHLPVHITVKFFGQPQIVEVKVK